ncbi:MAG TPA: ornithine carbamoyltransferase [Acidimicrobiales bacterium]|jgi:ornithine carbamoyltransferase
MVLRHLLDVDDLSSDELALVLDRSEHQNPPLLLERHGTALLFEKPSARTRSSMEVAVVQLGGHPVTIRGEEVGFDTRETVEDVTRTLCCYHSVIGARVFEHNTVERMAAVSSVPLVNLLSDRAHPVQALADLLTLRQRWGGLDGRSIAFVGDGDNNVCRSLMIACALAGVEVRVASPAGHQPAAEATDRARAHGGTITVTDQPAEAVKGADAVYTDVWVSMGQTGEAEERRAAFEGFTVDDDLMSSANEHAVFLHCLPAHRGEEVAASVIDSAASAVWPQAENRLHTARGLLWWLVERSQGD